MPAMDKTSFCHLEIVNEETALLGLPYETYEVLMYQLTV